MHGGATPAVRAAAERRRAEAQATALLNMIWDPDAEPITDPVMALQALAGRLEAASNVLGARLDADGVDLDGPTAVAWARVLRELRLALEGMERLGIANRVVELHQAQAQIVVTAFMLALERMPRLLPAERTEVVGAFLKGLGRGPDVVVGKLG